MACAAPAESDVSERILEGIELPEPPTPVLDTHNPEWKFLGRNPTDGRIYIYVSKISFVDDPDVPDLLPEGWFHLYVFSLQPVMNRWKQHLKLEIKAPTLDAREWCSRVGKAACFDFNGKCAGFSHYAVTGVGIFHTWDLLSNVCKAYVHKWEDDPDQWEDPVISIWDDFLGYSKCHRSFLALTVDREDNEGRIHKILLREEDITFAFESIVSFELTVYPFRFSFCPGFFAFLQNQKLRMYNFGPRTWESFQVFGLDYESDTVNVPFGQMQSLEDCVFVFPQIVSLEGEWNIGNLVKISPLGSFYEATALPMSELPVKRFKELNGRIVQLNEQVTTKMESFDLDGAIGIEENDLKTLEFGRTIESFYLTVRRLSVIKSDWPQDSELCDDRGISFTLVELPFPPYFVDPLSVLAARQVAKNISLAELWEGDEPKSAERISQLLGIPEKDVKKYFE